MIALRPVGDVNKGVWPTEVRRSNDVDNHGAKDASKINHVKCLNYIFSSGCLIKGSRVSLRLTLSPRGPFSPLGPCGRKNTQSQNKTLKTAAAATCQLLNIQRFNLNYMQWN